MRSSKTTLPGIPALLALGFFLFTSIASAQDPVIAIGKVDSDGTLLNHAHTLGPAGVVVSAQNGTGDYRITLTAAGQFTGAVATDILVELSVERSGSNSDDTAKAVVVSLNANQLQIDVNIDDVEDATNLSNPEARSLPFFFSIYRVPASFPAKGSTRFLEAVGQVDSDGDLLAGVGVNGITVQSSKNVGTGDYDVTLTKAGAFATAAVDDFVIMLTVRAINDQDRGVRGEISNITDDVVTIDVRVDQLQDATDTNDPEPINDQFYFTIYRIPSAAPTGIARSKMLLAMGSVDGSDPGADPLVSGGAFDGGTVVKTRVGTGAYDITITSAGAFDGKSVLDYALQVSLNQSGSHEDAITGFVTVPDANTLNIEVYTNDVEQVGETEGVPVDRDFFFFLYDAVAAFQPDLYIGKKKPFSMQLGDDLYNNTALGQRINLKLKKKRKRGFFFTLENDGNLTDRFFLKGKRSGNAIKSKYFRISNGRQNVTAKLVSGGLTEENVRPCRKIRYKGQVNYKGGRRPKKTLRFLGRSLTVGFQRDLNQAKLR